MGRAKKWVREPKQARSAQTLDRIVRAAGALLEEKDFDDISIAEIMQGANMSVGNFYTRFRNKAALLPYLYERYNEELERTAGEIWRPESWTGLTLVERVRRLVTITVNTYRARKGLWRAMLLHATSDESIVTEDYRRRRRAMVQNIVEVFLDCEHEIVHPDPRAAIEFSLILLFAVCKDRILLEDRSIGTAEASDDWLVDQLIDTLLAYLGGARARE